MARSAEVWNGPNVMIPDTRRDYGEAHFMTVGRLSARMVVLIWTPRGDTRRIISLRKANAREQARYASRLA